MTAPALGLTGCGRPGPLEVAWTLGEGQARVA
ncbi:lipoprotein [Bradyrhizobium cajani]